MLTVQLITSVTDELAREMSRLQQFLLKGKYGRPLNRDLFSELAETGFLVGAFYMPGVAQSYPTPEEVLAGMCYLFTKQTISRKVMLYEELVVDPKWRGLGIADRIDEFLIALARKEGCDCIEGVMPVGNEPVKKVHLRNGFTIREQYPFRLILNHF